MGVSFMSDLTHIEPADAACVATTEVYPDSAQ